MAGGNNKSFRKNPVPFIRTHQLMINPQAFSKAQVLQAGNMDIDLVTVDPKNPGFIRLENFNRRKHGWGAKALRSFFLPAIFNNTSTININTTRNYMFTADLSGCLFAAYGANANTITVEHVNVRSPTALVPILPRAQAIIVANYNFYKILSPVAVLGADAAHVKVYAQNSSVIGIKTGAGWVFHYKPSMATVAQL